MFDICNIFYVLESRNMVYAIPSHSRGKVEKYSEKDQRTEAADTMHNVIIPSGRVENRQLENQSLLAISQLLAQRERGTVRQCGLAHSSRTKIRLCSVRTLGCVRPCVSRKNVLFPDLITINI